LALEAAQVGAINAAVEGQLFLGVALPNPKAPQIPSN
jgi:hypothetical protein